MSPNGNKNIGIRDGIILSQCGVMKNIYPDQIGAGGTLMKNFLILVAVLATAMCMSSCGYTDRVKARSEATIAEAQARQKEADSAAQIAQSQAEQNMMHTLADAAKPDNTVLLLVLVATFGIGGLVVYKLMQTNLVHAQTTQAVIMAQLPQQAYRALPEPPIEVQIAARHWRGHAEHNGSCWQIVDGDGRVLASEQYQISG